MTAASTIRSKAHGSGRKMSARISTRIRSTLRRVNQFNSSAQERHNIVSSAGGTISVMTNTLDLGDAGAGVEALAARYERGYVQSDVLTIGIEEELILVDPGSFAPAEAIESVLGAVPDPRVTAEFRAAQVELVTPVGLTVGALRGELAAARAAMVDALGGRVRLLGAGTPPAPAGPAQSTD